MWRVDRKIIGTKERTKWIVSTLSIKRFGNNLNFINLQHCKCNHNSINNQLMVRGNGEYESGLAFDRVKLMWRTHKDKTNK